MNDQSHPLAQAERVVAPRGDYIDTVEATLTLGRRTFDVGLDLHGAYCRGFPATRETPAEGGGYAIDRVLWRDRDVTACIGDELMEALTEFANRNEEG